MKVTRYLTVVTVLVLVLPGLLPGTLSAQRPTSDRSILYYQRILQRNPGDPSAYYRLGDAYIQKARETGDVSYFNLAEDALRRSLAIAPKQSGALRHLAYVLYSRHEFAEAAVQAEEAIALDPTDSHAHGILGDAYLEVGKYELAEQTYERMAHADGDLYSYGRRAGLRSLRGDAEGAIEDLGRAIEAGRARGRPAESIAWTQWQLGSEHFNVGNLRAAEAGYEDALSTYPNYPRALAGLAQVRAAQGRHAEAIELYQKALAIIPQPDYAAALGDVFAKAGRREDARKQYDLVEYIGQLSTLNKVIYNRELAYFYADHDTKLDQALDLARRELEVRRDVYAYNVLAWVLYKTGKLQEAQAAMAAALRLGTRDARLFFHAGMIERRLGNAEAARGHLRRALATNPHFHILHAEEAERVLRELGPEVSDGR